MNSHLKNKNIHNEYISLNIGVSKGIKSEVSLQWINIMIGYPYNGIFPMEKYCNRCYYNREIL